MKRTFQILLGFLMTFSFLIGATSEANAQCWSSVAKGREHSLGIKSDGTLWAWGDYSYGRLGIGASSNIPVQVGNETNWQKVVVGYYHSMGLKSDGSLWVWGRCPNPNWQPNANIPSTIDYYTPTQVSPGSTWLDIAASDWAFLGIKTNGSLWVWGIMSAGGSNHVVGSYATSTLQTVPLQIGMDTDWQKISASYQQALIIKNNGTLWALGQNIGYVLGISQSGATTPVQVGTANNWSSVGMGYYHSLGIKTNGTLWAWGNNTYGELGNGTNTDQPTPSQVGTLTTWQKVAVGEHFSVAVRGDSLFSWGLGNYGSLGNVTLSMCNRNKPACIGAALGGWSNVSAGGFGALAINPTQGLFSWGQNDMGQLGIGNTYNRPDPTAVDNCGNSPYTSQVQIESITPNYADLYQYPCMTSFTPSNLLTYTVRLRNYAPTTSTYSLSWEATAFSPVITSSPSTSVVSSANTGVAGQEIYTVTGTVPGGGSYTDVIFSYDLSVVGLSAYSPIVVNARLNGSNPAFLNDPTNMATNNTVSLHFLDATFSLTSNNNGGIAVTNGANAVVIGYETFASNTGSYYPEQWEMTDNLGNTYSISVDPSVGTIYDALSYTTTFPSGVYTITRTILDLNGLPCLSNTQTVNVVACTPPTLTATTNNATLCAGSPAQFQATSTGTNAANTYSWYPATNLSAADVANPVFTPPVVTSGGAVTHSYTVYATNACGMTNNANVSVVVNPLPVNNLSSTMISVCAGSGAVAIGTSSSSGNTYTWTRSAGAPAPNSSYIANPAIVPPASVLSLTNYTYTLTVRNTATGCVNTKSRTIQVKPQLTGSITISSNPASGIVCQGSSIILTASPAVSTTTYGTITYRWYRDVATTMPFATTTSATTTLTSTTANYGAHTYYVTASNGCGTITSNTISCIIQPTAIPSISATTTAYTPSTISFCSSNGNKALNTVIPTTTPPVTPIAYTWTFSPTSTGTYQTIFNGYTASLSNNQVQHGNYYKVTVDYGNNCKVTSTQKYVTVNLACREAANSSSENETPLNGTAINVYPNPFETITNVAYQMEKEENISIELFDLNGKKVQDILPRTTQAAGNYEKEVNTENLAKGMYLLILKTGDTVQTAKIVKE